MDYGQEQFHNEYESLDDVEIHGDPEPFAECAKECGAGLTEDDLVPGVYEADAAKSFCLHCAAEDAVELLLAETRHDFAPTRSIGERQRALDVVRIALARADERISRDAERLAIRRLS